VKLNNSDAMNSLAISYKNGQGVEQNMEKAIQLYESAVKLNNSDAMNNLAICYKKGRGIEKNYQIAFDLFRQATKKAIVMQCIDVFSLFLMRLVFKEILKIQFLSFKWHVIINPSSH
jgi:tetratricopeptide (TPR) repeat protein